MNYQEFCAAKASVSGKSGFAVAAEKIHPMLKPHQRDIVRWALDGGRRAIFAAFGLGKSFMQLEIMRQVQAYEGGRQLIISPLGVRQEFKNDAAKLGFELRFVRRDDEIEGDGLYLTNYESVRDGRLHVEHFNAASLDEASVLRSFGSLTYQTFLTLFDAVKYRFVATATPSPNRYKELIHYAGFLGIMDTGQALTRFFQRDSTKANNLTLYQHMEKEFWVWVSSWAVFLQKPSDLGYSDDGYILPKLHVHYHKVSVLGSAWCDKRGQFQLVDNAAMSLQAASRVKRDSLPARIEKMQEILAAMPADEHCIIWHDQEAERHAIKKAVPEVVDIHGSMDLDEREQRVMDFSDGKIRLFASKPILSGSGCNFQRHCHTAIYLGIGFKFNDFIQSIHRIHRFLQEKECHIHLIYAESEVKVLEVLQQKWTQHNEMVERMQEIIKKYGLSTAEMVKELQRGMGVERIEVRGEKFLVANNDTVMEAQGMKENSVDLIVTSIPFSNHYEYSPNYCDMGHTDNNEHFWAQMDYLTPELLRILKPGRIYCCHTKDRILFGNVTGKGAPTVSPFHMEATFHAMKHGFDYMGMITVVTDVVRENNQTYRLGWTEQCKDGTKMGVGSPEYILLFRKPQTDRTKGYADEPVTKSKEEYSRSRWQIDAHAFWRSSGNRMVTPDELAALTPDVLATAFTEASLAGTYDYEEHVRIGEHLDAKGALPCTFMALAPGSHCADVWHDICRMKTLNSKQSQRGLQNHVCLADGSLVLTRCGYKPIEKVEIGDFVLTHKGNWKPVIAKRCTGINPVIRTKAQGVANMITTPDHKLWARVTDKVRAKDYMQKTAPNWIEAQKCEGGYVNLKLPAVEKNDLTLKEWWIVGRFLADGHRGTRGDFFVSIGEKKIAEFEEKAAGYFGTYADRTARQYRLKNLSEYLKNMLNECGRGAANKQVPLAGICANQEQAKALLEGYLSGDGCTTGNATSATSVSRALLLGMAMVAQRAYGVIASVFPGKNAGKTTIEGREVNTRQEWVMSWRNGSHKFGAILDDGAWKKVNQPVDCGEAETWSIQVADDASYTAEGCIVKNCPLQIDIVERLIERYSNPGELVYDPFGGLMTVPYCAIKKGRRGRGVELNTGYFLDGVKYCRAAESEMTAPSLFDLCGVKR